MSARVFTFEGDWIAARVRRSRRGWIEALPDSFGELITMPVRRRAPRFVQVLESCSENLWMVFGVEDWREARFEDLISAMNYAHEIAGPALASIEVYRRDRELSA